MSTLFPIYRVSSVNLKCPHIKYKNCLLKLYVFLHASVSSKTIDTYFISWRRFYSYLRVLFYKIMQVNCIIVSLCQFSWIKFDHSLKNKFTVKQQCMQRSNLLFYFHKKFLWPKLLWHSHETRGAMNILFEKSKVIS